MPHPLSTRAGPPGGAPSQPVGQDCDAIHEAATRGDLGLLVRRLPASVQSRLLSMQQGIVLPTKDKHRRRFLNELAGLSARLLEPARTEVERAWRLLAGRGYGHGMASRELETIEKTFALIRELAALSMRSSKPADYLRLLSRPGVDVPRFVTTMCFFAGDRRIQMRKLDMAQRRVALEMVRFAGRSSQAELRALLSHIVDRLPAPAPGAGPYDSDWRVLQAFDLAAGIVREPQALARLLRRDHGALIRDRSFFGVDEMVERIAKARYDDRQRWFAHQFFITCGIYLTRAGQMLRFGKMFKQGPIEGYVVLKPERLRAYGYEAVASARIDDPTALLASEKEHTIQHELQHMFDKIIYVESAVRSAESVRGQSRGNLFGMEYRARLAEMAFTSDLGLVEESLAEIQDNLAAGDTHREEMSIRVLADRRVAEKIGRFRKGASLRRLARILLDQAYRQAYGLTYTQIVEPFGPAICTPPRSGRPL